MAALRQLQLRYDAVEDRILLRVSTQQDQAFRLWLTRRYCTLLLAVLDEYQRLDPEVAERPTEEARRAVQRFKEEAAGSRADFGREFREPAERPLGDAPMLAWRLTYRADEARLQLTFSPQRGQGVTFTLDRQLGLNLHSMLTQTVRAADWGLLPRQAPAAEHRVVN